MPNPNNKRKEKNKKRLEELIRGSTFVVLFFLFMFLIVNYGPEEFSLARLTGYVSFSTSPSMSSAYTNNDLSCSWTHDDTINITLIWLNNSIQFSNVTGNTTTVTSPQTLDSSNTSKGENWTCRVTLFNATDNITEETSVIIANSPPTNLKVYYNEVEVESSFDLYEDTVYNLVVNATDVDNDELAYEITAGSDPLDICSVTIDTGEVTCLVDHDILDDGGEITKYQNDTQFQATDYEGSIPVKLIDFTLIPVNDPPSLTISSYVVNVTVDTVYLQPFSVTDEENDNYNLSIDVVKISGSGNPNYIEINSASKKVYFNTSDGSAAVVDYGVYNITLAAFDSSNSSNNDTLTYELTINSTNHPPNLTDVSSPSGVQGEPFRINLTAYELDLNDSLTYSAIHTSFGSHFTNELNYTVGNITYFNATLNITALTNEHIVNRNFTIYVSDKVNANDSIDINAALNNTNDAPIIYDNSTNTNNINSGSNNITNLSAYKGVQFIYYINYTDVDSLTYEGEELYFSMNDTSSIFNLTNLGRFTFYSTDESYIGDYYINITLHDDGSSNYVAGTNLSYSKIMILHILNNTIPYFVSGLSNTDCSEDLECYMKIVGNDTDTADNVSYILGAISVLNNYGNSDLNLTINGSTGVINFTPAQEDIGNYSITINLSDSRGAIAPGSFNLTINNTNDAPALTFPIVFPSTIYFEVPYSSNTLITATDEDLDLVNSTESLTYSYSLSPNTLGLFILNSSTGKLTINTAIPGCNQSYNVTINVTDVSGASDNVDSSFIIKNRGSSPEINAIYPYGNASNNNTIVLAWNSSLNEVSGGITTVVADEGNAIIFNHSTTDSDSSTLSYNWSINDTNINDSQIIDSGHTLNFTNGYFSNGTYNITLSINDSAFNFVNWTWNLTIENVNRAPQLINPLPNFTGAKSFSYMEITSYFTIPSIDQGDQRFYDPDFDVNNNSLLDLNETSGLTYNFTSGCDDYATITIANDSITLSGIQQGNCSLFFNASDSDGLTVMSNEVFVNVTEQYTEPEPETIASSGSSGSTTVPFSVDNNDDPVPLEIITARSVVIYKNSTMIIPIELRNNWSTQLTGLIVSVNTDEDEVGYNLSEAYFNSIAVDEKEHLNLTIYNYREPGSYEIDVSVSVATPEFEDTVTIIVNSLEEAHKGETLETKLAFARDLLESSDDCKELYEILSQAEESLKAGNHEKTAAYLDLTINACKYMISNKDLITTDNSGKINLIIDHNFLRDLLKNKTNLIITSVVLIVLIVLIGLLILYKKLRLKKLKVEGADEYS